MVLSDVAAGHGRLSAAEREARLRARLDDLETLGPAGMAQKRAPNLLGSAQIPETIEKVASTMAKIDPKGYAQAARMLSTGDILADLEGCTKPAIVICGAEDRVTPPEGNRAVAALLPNARYHELARVGHLPYVEAADAFNRLVADFLARQSPERAA
jgi:pimeloyl-ACP methyl ester carboxylesterase